MKVAKELIFGNPNLGLFGIANNEFAVLPSGYDKSRGLDRFKRVLGVKLYEQNIYESPLVGMFISSNSKGFVTPTKTRIGKFRGIKLNDRYTCLGNLVLANDRGALIAKGFSRFAAKQIADALKVRVTRGTIAGLEVVGSCCLANNNGALVHPEAKKRELKILEEALGVKAEVGTLNRGSPYVGSCGFVNDAGAVVGYDTMPVEVTRLEDALGQV